MERVLTTKEARAMFAALDEQREARAERAYQHGHTIGSLTADALPRDADAVNGFVDGLLAAYYRGALEARARLARELCAYIVEEISDAEGVYTEQNGE